MNQMLPERTFANPIISIYLSNIYLISIFKIYLIAWCPGGLETLEVDDCNQYEEGNNKKSNKFYVQVSNITI